MEYPPGAGLHVPYRFAPARERRERPPELDFDRLDVEREERPELVAALRRVPLLPELVRLRLAEGDPPLRRSAAGISSRATLFASVGICFSRKLAMRSSSRRIPRASFAVSRSPTASASASMPVYIAISSCSAENSVFAFLSIFSLSPVPRSACSGPLAADTALDATSCAVDAASATGAGRFDSVEPPSCLTRRSTARACALVSFRCC